MKVKSDRNENLRRLSGSRVLQIAHSHPRYHPGGTELTAIALHHEAGHRGFDSWYLGALDRSQIAPKPGTNMITLTADQRETALFVHRFDQFRLAQDDDFGFLTALRAYLEQVRPDIVHVHHVLGFGLESLYVIRATLPDCQLILTLHDYYLICPNHGQLFKQKLKQRCDGPELHQCLKCLPERSEKDFELRRLDIRSALRVCDKIVSPSSFLQRKFQKYLDFPLEIAVVENGYVGMEPPNSDDCQDREGPLVFGYFGNISPIKGLADLLDAAEILDKNRPGDFRIAVHGSQLFEDGPLYDRMRQSAAALGARIRYHGKYSSTEVGTLLSKIDCLVFPSIWWENAPLVIYEAIYHGRLVISYPHGGAPEILARYNSGIVAESSDPQALANAMEKVIDNRTLVHPKRAPIPGRKELFERYSSIYSSNR